MCPILVLLTFLPIFAFSHPNDDQSDGSGSKKKKNCKSQFPCQKAISFGSDEINQKGGFVITKPGKYCLKENAKRKKKGTAVTINASNVVIDLNEHTLSGKNSATTGIVANNSVNLTIQNGTVRNFTVNGININGSDNIVLNTLLVLRNGNDHGPTFTGGLTIFNSSRINMTSVQLSENFNFGLGMSGIDTANFINSRSNATKSMHGDTIFGDTAYGIYVASTGGTGTPFTQGSSNMNFINCLVDNTTGADSAFGFFIDSLAVGTTPVGTNSNIIIENCSVNNTTQTNVTPTAGTLAPFIEGITMAGGFGVNIKNCVVDTLTGAAKTDSPGSHYVGIEVSAADHAIIDNCSVSNAIGIANFVHGFDIEASGNDITYSNCTAYAIKNNSKNPAHFAVGFAILKPIGIPTIDSVGTGTVVQNCIAQNVHGPKGASAGGLLLNAQKNVVIENNIFNNSDNGILAQTLLPNLHTSNGLIRNNVTDGNKFFGILELTSAKNAYYGNTARTNGHGNYLNLPPNTPMVTWHIDSAPTPSNGFVLDNYDITP